MIDVFKAERYEKLSGRGFGLPAGGVDVVHYCPFYGMFKIFCPLTRRFYMFGGYLQSLCTLLVP